MKVKLQLLVFIIPLLLFSACTTVTTSQSRNIDCPTWMNAEKTDKSCGLLVRFVEMGDESYDYSIQPGQVVEIEIVSGEGIGYIHYGDPKSLTIKTEDGTIVDYLTHNFEAGNRYYITVASNMTLLLEDATNGSSGMVFIITWAYLSP